MARILDVPPVLVPEVLRDGTRLTQRWTHGPVRKYMRGMDCHVVVGSYGSPVSIGWQVEGRWFRSHTACESFTLIPEDHDGLWALEGDVVVSHVYVPRDRLRALAEVMQAGRSTELLPRVGFHDPIATRLLAILGDEASQADSSTRLFVEQAVDLLCLQLVRSHSSFPPIALLRPSRGLAEWQVRRVAQYMHDNLDQSIGLAELAGLIGLSRYHFCTAFRAATGRTPHAHLTEMRMKRARQLLTATTLSITEIALAVGFETPSAFASSFRKNVGATPSSYRRTTS